VDGYLLPEFGLPAEVLGKEAEDHGIAVTHEIPPHGVGGGAQIREPAGQEEVGRAQCSGGEDDGAPSECDASVSVLVDALHRIDPSAPSVETGHDHPRPQIQASSHEIREHRACGIVLGVDGARVPVAGAALGTGLPAVATGEIDGHGNPEGLQPEPRGGIPDPSGGGTEARERLGIRAAPVRPGGVPGPLPGNSQDPLGFQVVRLQLPVVEGPAGALIGVKPGTCLEVSFPEPERGGPVEDGGPADAFEAADSSPVTPSNPICRAGGVIGG
jgi:hypothetical protein